MLFLKLSSLAILLSCRRAVSAMTLLKAVMKSAMSVMCLGMSVSAKAQICKVLWKKGPICTVIMLGALSTCQRVLSPLLDYPNGQKIK